MTDYQTRDDEGELRYFDSAVNAFRYAMSNPSVWKVSFDGVRMVKYGDWWKFTTMDDVVNEMMKEEKA